jgi:alpha-methylacyl-CoA racemase
VTTPAEIAKLDEFGCDAQIGMALYKGVLDLAEAPTHPHNQARATFLHDHGVVQPAPAPRFSGTPAAPPKPAPKRGADTAAVLADWGFTPSEIAAVTGG